MAMLEHSLRARVIPRGARNYRAYADLAAGYEERVWSSNGTANRVDAHADRAGGRDHAVERAVHALDLEDRARARGRLHRRPEAGRVVAALVLAARRPRGRGRPAAGRLQRRAGHRRGGRRGARRRPARAPRVASPARPRRRATSAGSAAAQHRPVHRRARRQGPAASSSPTPTSRPRRRRRRASTTTPARSASRARACSSRSRSASRSSSASTATPTRTCSATRAPTTRPSRRSSTPTTSRASRASSSARARTATRSCAAAAGPTSAGCWYEPTLIEPRSNDSEIVQREVFGPVLTFQTFARRGRGGRARQLDAPTASRRIVYTGSQERAERVGRAVRAGTVWVNTFLVRDLTAPFGGIGISGIGREGGDYALDFYSDLKTLQIRGGLDRMSARAGHDRLRERCLRRRDPARDVPLAAPERAGALVRLALRPRLLGGHAPRRPRRGAPGHHHLLVRARRHRPRGPRAGRDRGPQVDARHRSAPAHPPAGAGQPRLHPARRGRLRETCCAS